MNGFDDIFEAQAPKNDFHDKPFDKEAWGAQKQAERKEVYELADATALDVASDGGKFREYLDMQSKFDRYSVTNTLLLLAQMPQATQVKDFDAWKDAGATIKRHEKGISILEPGDEYKKDDGSIGTSYNVKKVFDISQTTSRAKGKATPNVTDRQMLKALIHRPPVPIQMVDELAGNAGAVYDHEQQAIFVKRGMDAPNLFRCVSMALARAEIAASDAAFDRDYDHAQAGFPAYCVSYILCQKNGVDVSSYDFSQLPEGLREADAQGVREVLGEIRDTAHDISARMSRALEQDKAPRGKEQER